MSKQAAGSHLIFPLMNTYAMAAVGAYFYRRLGGGAVDKFVHNLIAQRISLFPFLLLRKGYLPLILRIGYDGWGGRISRNALKRLSGRASFTPGCIERFAHKAAVATYITTQVAHDIRNPLVHHRQRIVYDWLGSRQN